MMLHPHNLHDYQRECVMHQLQHDESMLWLGMGLGKTPTTLTTIVDRMRAGQVQKTLIFGPLRVIQAVWAREARKWSHTQHLRFSVIHGNKEKRSRALFADADIYLTNYENMNWLAQELDHYYLSQDKPLPFQMVVYDEVSKLKNSTSLRMAGGDRDRKDRYNKVHKVKVTGWRKVIPHFKYRTGLTGTPASNGYLDLHGQYLAVDNGERLGKFITHYKDSYFMSDYNGWNYTPTEIGKQWIEHKISDITKKMDAKDYLDLPDCKVTNLMVDMPPKARKAYEDVEKQMFTQLDTGSEIEVFSRSSVSNKTLQFCNGSPYLSAESPEFEALHDAKLDALEDVLEEAAGSPVLCSYTFKSDAERIMKRFKKYRPINLTTTPSNQTESIINKWNNGQVKLLIGHPACLHPSTQVLTEQRGWVKIVDVKHDERVFDGVEFVSHDGCSYSGYKEVTDVFGITMTPDHKLLIDGEWVEAQDVGSSEEVRQKALYQYEGDDPRIGEMLSMSNRVRDYSSERNKAQSIEQDSLSALCSGSLPQYDRYSDSSNMGGTEASCKRSFGQKLRWSWDYHVQNMGRLYDVLHRHVTGLFGRSDDRTQGREQTILQGQLHMGDNVRTTRQQANEQNCHLSGGEYSSGRVGTQIGVQQDYVTSTTESWDDGRRSSHGCSELTLWKESETIKCKASGSTKEDVYDLVNCGPRHRFVIRNDNGDVFISHNSMGHGVDGLQESGHILVWFGLNWSLELYEQMNGRINRQGQSQPVSIIRILCNDSVDLAVADALERKTDDQEGLKRALQRYRDGVTTNDLEVNFF